MMKATTSLIPVSMLIAEREVPKQHEQLTRVKAK